MPQLEQGISSRGTVALEQPCDASFCNGCEGLAQGCDAKHADAKHADALQPSKVSCAGHHSRQKPLVGNLEGSRGE